VFLRYFLIIGGYSHINRVYYKFALTVLSNEEVNRFAIIAIQLNLILGQLYSHKITRAGVAEMCLPGISSPAEMIFSKLCSKVLRFGLSGYFGSV
jgi:hypothetical protein